MTFCESCRSSCSRSRSVGNAKLAVTVLSESPVSVTPEFFGIHVYRRAMIELPGIQVKTVRGARYRKREGTLAIYRDQRQYVELHGSVIRGLNTHYRQGGTRLHPLRHTHMGISKAHRNGRLWGRKPGHPSRTGGHDEMGPFLRQDCFPIPGKDQVLRGLERSRISTTTAQALLPAPASSFPAPSPSWRKWCGARIIAIKAVDPAAKIISP